METKVLASIIRNAKEQAIATYDGYELVAAYEIIRWIQESMAIELPASEILKFEQDCNIED